MPPSEGRAESDLEDIDWITLGGPSEVRQKDGRPVEQSILPARLILTSVDYHLSRQHLGYE